MGFVGENIQVHTSARQFDPVASFSSQPASFQNGHDEMFLVLPTGRLFVR